MLAEAAVCFSEGVGRRGQVAAAELAAATGVESEGELKRRNCTNHFRKEMRTEEKQAPCLGIQVIKH